MIMGWSGLEGEGQEGDKGEGLMCGCRENQLWKLMPNSQSTMTSLSRTQR